MLIIDNYSLDIYKKVLSFNLYCTIATSTTLNTDQVLFLVFYTPALKKIEV